MNLLLTLLLILLLLLQIPADSVQNVDGREGNVRVDSSGFLFEPVTVAVAVTSSNGTRLKEKAAINVDYRPFTVIPRKENSWNRIHQTPLNLSTVPTTLPCHLFVFKGVYRIHVDGFNQSVELSLNSSRVVPTVDFRTDSIYPHCAGDFAVKWSLPQCFIPEAMSAQFRIRILAILDAPENLPEEYNYVEEIPIHHQSNESTDASMTTIPCSQFDILYKKYCFELVTVDDRAHFVDDWTRKCVFTENVNRVDGGWASWSQYTPCSRTCGNGVRKRFRTCTEPVPNSRGKFCPGQAVEASLCSVRNCTSALLEVAEQANSSQFEALSTNMSASQNLSCRCGCHLHHQHHGFIFASRRLACANRTLLWTLPRQESTKVHLQILEENNKGRHFDLLRVLRGPSMEILWSSDSSKQAAVAVSMDEDLFFLFETRNKPQPADRPVDGFYVEFKFVKDLPKLISLSREYSAQLGLSWAFGRCHSAACQNTIVFILLVAVIIVLASLIALPPLVCSYATQKYGKRRGTTGSQMSEALLTSLSQRFETEMLRSNETESTRIHDNAGSSQEPYSVAKRSIGIQLSVQSTPRASRSPARNASIPSMDELEYDYYDPVVPGSLLRPYLVSEVDIDKIVEMETSGWLGSSPSRASPPDVLTCDVTTQVDSL